MRIYRGMAGEKGFAGLLSPSIAAIVTVSAWVAGSVGNKVWVSGGLSRSAAHSLDQAILVIGLPAVFFFIGIFFYIYRRRGAWRGHVDDRSSSNPDSTAP